MAEDLSKLVSEYKPNNKIAQQAQQICVLALIGPSAVGKTTLMEEAVKAIPELTMVGGVTSRARRPGEGTQEFSFLTKNQILAEMKDGAYVQVAVSPSGDLYATRPEDYEPDKIGIMAVLSSVVPDFRQLFGAVIVVAITPPSFDIWLSRFNERNNRLHDRQIRLSEAKDSLDFVLHDKATHFILNGQMTEAIFDLQSIIKKNYDVAKESRAKKITSEIYKQLISL